MDVGVRGKVVLVTGASSGIGCQTAILYAREGAKVLGTFNKDREAAQQAEAEMRRAADGSGSGGGVLMEALDMGDTAAISALVDKINERWGGVDILVNAAAAYGRTNFDFENDGLERWNEAVSVDLTGAFVLTKAVFPYMKEEGWGRIVYVGSTAGEVGVENAAHYGAAKAGLSGLTRGLARDLGRYGILVNCVAPARVRTLKQEQTIPRAELDEDASFVSLGRLATVDDVARTVLFLASGWNTFVSGQTVLVDGGGRLRKPLVARS